MECFLQGMAKEKSGKLKCYANKKMKNLEILCLSIPWTKPTRIARRKNLNWKRNYGAGIAAIN